MTAIIVLLALLALSLAAGVVAALDMRPDRRRPDWSIGTLIQPRR